MGAPRALANLGNAMLSAEILAFSIVAVLALVYSLIWWKASDKAGLRKIFGALTAVGGLVAIVITSQVYALAAHPAWNNWTTPVFFLLTAVVLGAFTILFLLTRAKNEELEKGVKTFAIVGLAAIAAIVIVFGCYVGLTEKAVLANMVASPLFMVRLLVGLLVPAVCGGLALAGKANAAVVGLVCVLIGELCARILFYASTMVMYPWF